AMSEQAVQITTFVDFVEDQLAVSSSHGVYDSKFPAPFTWPRLEKPRSRGSSAVLCETRGRVVSETQLYTVRVKVRNELRRIEDADSHVGCREVNVISLLAPSGANPICLLGADGNYEFVAGIPGMPPLWSNAEPDHVSAE